MKIAKQLTFLLLLMLMADRSRQETCASSPELTFEVVTGFVFTAPGEILDTRGDTLQLAECIDFCTKNSTCQSLNFETGLCVLFRSSAANQPGTLTRSHFPVFTIYAQKVCLSGASEACGRRPWSFEVVPDFQMTAFIRDRRRVASRRACMELCLQERTFQCRSASYNEKTGECALSDLDRFSVTSKSAFETNQDVDYFESNCVDDPVKMCDFQRTEGRILKTVDAVYQDVLDLDACRTLCLNADFRCHSFDYGDTGERVCRLSHHAAGSLTQIPEAYLEIPSTATHELSSCYNVTIDCRSTDMVVKVKTNRIFSGKIYSKSRPNSCMTDVVKDLEFELRLGYQDVECDVQRDGPGKYFTEVVIQHHDQIVTSQDLGLALRCTYQLKNYTLTSGLDLSVASRIPTAASESTVVPPPTVTMRITLRNGADVSVAQVGDPLSLRFEIQEPNSPYEIFVRELVAFDGTDNSEIMLIDQQGCPTDQDIMGPVSKVNGTHGVLQVPFDAFKFPTSDVVQFKALVTPCLPHCQPVKCQIQDYFGFERRIESLGRRRRRRDADLEDKENLLVAQSIRIADKFHVPGAVLPSSQRETQQSAGSFSEAEVTVLGSSKDQSSSTSRCLDMLGLLISGALLLAAQAVLIAAWAFVWQKRRLTKAGTEQALSNAVGPELRIFPAAFVNLGFSRK